MSLISNNPHNAELRYAQRSNPIAGHDRLSASATEARQSMWLWLL
jgi:hypothetical protein